MSFLKWLNANKIKSAIGIISVAVLALSDALVELQKLFS